MTRHTILHILGCALPLLLIFALPILGISGEATIFVFIIAMFACHLLMMRGHGHAHDSHSHPGRHDHEPDSR
jgi:hypothetical protein